MGEKDRKRQEWERERERERKIGRETGWEKEVQGRKRER